MSLLVSSDKRLSEVVRRVAQRLTVVLHVHSHVEALSVLPQNASWAGVVLDLDERGADPLTIAQRLRDADALAPILALGSMSSRELVNGLQAIRAELLVKPVDSTNVHRFLRRALVSGWLPDARISAWVDTQAQVRGLTDREVQLMAYALGRESREQVLRRLGITANTLKTQVRRLLRKFSARTVDSLVARALGEALIFEDLSSGCAGGEAGFGEGALRGAKVAAGFPDAEAPQASK